MRKNIRSTIIILFTLVSILVFCDKSEALYITIENIGNYPIVAVHMGFLTEPYKEENNFNIWSLLHPDPTNYLLQIDWTNPIGVGETYYTPLIPELTDVNFHFLSYGVSGPNIAMGGSGIFLIRDVIPDISKYTEYNSDIGFGVTFAFHAGGQPIPEPSTILLLGFGLAGVGLLRRRFKS